MAFLRDKPRFHKPFVHFFHMRAAEIDVLVAMTCNNSNNNNNNNHLRLLIILPRLPTQTYNSNDFLNFRNHTPRGRVGSSMKNPSSFPKRGLNGVFHQNHPVGVGEKNMWYTHLVNFKFGSDDLRTNDP